ncbi:MAG: hydrogenase maturation protease [Promethearchaeota archaeon]
MENFVKKLMEKFSGATKIVFMGIGEEKLSDDAVGIYIISELLSYSNDRYLFINAGIDPMSRIEQIIEFNPSHLCIFDTCTLNGEPGTVSIIEREHIANVVPISSHTIPIQIVIDLILKALDNINIFMIGFVPESLEGFEQLTLYKSEEIPLEERIENIDLPFFEINLTPSVKRAADNIIQAIKKLLDSL